MNFKSQLSRIYMDWKSLFIIGMGGGVKPRKKRHSPNQQLSMAKVPVAFTIVRPVPSCRVALEIQLVT